MTTYLTITPRDPIIARDGRPFLTGMRMKSLDWPLPSVLAGSFRTLLGHLHDSQFDPHELKQVSVAGCFPWLDGQLWFPAPRDIAIRDAGVAGLQAHALRPARLNEGEGCDLPDDSLRPVTLGDEVGGEFKPAPAPMLWSAERIVDWLTSEQGHNFILTDGNGWRDGFLDGPAKDERMHVRLDYDLGAASEGQLFKTIGLDLLGLPKPAMRNGSGEDGLADRHAKFVELLARVEVDGANPYAPFASDIDARFPLGGERRLVHWQTQGASGWTCPDRIAAALSNAGKIRMVLATPAIFSGNIDSAAAHLRGWLPGWLRPVGGRLEGTPPSSDVKLRLVGVSNGRWQPISGWSLEQGAVGPKPVRRMVPAGSVYFFEVADSQTDPQELGDRWLRSVCDDDQDQRDGFGLALWGVWDEFDEPQGSVST